MAKVLNKNVLNGAIPKLVEIQDEYVINGQIYDKSTFVPKPFQNLQVVSTPNAEMSTNKMLNFEGAGFNRSECTIMIDKNDPDTTYIVRQGIYSSASYICKVTRKDKLTDYKASSITGSGVGSNLELIDQDDVGIYYIEHRIPGSANYIGRFRKDTNTIDLSYTLGVGKVNVLKINDNFVYLGVYNENNAFRIHKYNKTNGAGTIIFDDKKDGYHICGDIPKFNENNVSFAIRDGYWKPGGNHSVAFRKYSIDTVSDVVVATDVNINLSNYSNGTDFIPIFTNTNTSTYDLFQVIGNSKKYMCLVKYANASPGYIDVRDSSLLLFEMIDDDNWKLVQEIYFKPIIYTGCIYCNNKNTIILGDKSRLHFYSWNATSCRFEQTSVFEKLIQLVGIDMNNNVLIQLQDTSIELLSNTMPIKIEANFEKSDYDYVGSDIATTAYVYAQNFIGKYLSTSVKLQIVGPAVFADTNSKQMTITTSSTGAVNIPVKIKDAGFVKINTKIL